MKHSVSPGPVADWLQEALRLVRRAKARARWPWIARVVSGGQSEGKGMGGCKVVFEEQIFHSGWFAQDSGILQKGCRKKLLLRRVQEKERGDSVYLTPSLVRFSCSLVSDSLQPHGPQHARPPCPSPVSGVYPNSCSLSRWCHPTISSSVIPFSFYPILGSINLLEQLTELRETFHFPGCLFPIKGCNSGWAE